MFNANYEMFKSMIIGKTIGVLGLGISNIPAIKFLKERGAFVVGCDKKMAEEFESNVMKELILSCNKLYFGEDYLDHMSEFDIILKAPGIKLCEPQIQKAIESGKNVTSEMEIFMSLCPCKIIGVTGSDGKTTTTTIISEMLKREGYRVHLGGNIGRPLLSQLEDIYEDDIAVIELSSFQLQSLHVSPLISVITNITPNHLDYHKDMDEYTQAKANIFKYHTEESKLVLNLDNKVTNSLKDNYRYKLDTFTRNGIADGAYVSSGRIYYRGNPIIDIDSIRIKGWHNVENYMAAICAVEGLVSTESICYVAENFGGVEHRMEFVRSVDGVDFYNDSIGSSPTRTIAGLNAQPAGKIVLIAGGYDKNLDYKELGVKIVERVSVAVLMGATADKIEYEIQKASEEKRKVPIVHAKDMEMAVKSAFAMAKGLYDGEKNVSVILSPASASFDMYKNFEVRGKDFKGKVNEL